MILAFQSWRFSPALQEGGWGLHQILQDNEWKLSGIVNGMDYKEWSPENDEFLQVRGPQGSIFRVGTVKSSPDDYPEELMAWTTQSGKQ